MTSSRNRDREGKKPIGEAAASISTRRRRLIKGAAAAAPGIFTLYSGNAQAISSAYQCIVHSSRQAFTGDEEYAGEEHGAGGFVRLAEGPGIRVVRPSLNNPLEERWLIEVDDAFFEAGQAQQTGASWNEVLSGDKAWSVIGSGTPRKFKDPKTNLPYDEDVSQPPTVQVLACVDDNGNVVSTSPQECGDLTPITGSCWASAGPEHL